MGYRRVPPRFQSGQLTPQDAEALNQIAADLYRIVGGFSAAPPLIVQEDSNGVRIGLQGAIGGGSGGGILSQFVVLQNTNDLLLCAPFVQDRDAQGNLKPHLYDPNFGQGFPGQLYIAKPYQLQQTPFDGKTVVLNGTAIALHYTGIGLRTATNPNGVVENQVVVPDYFTGDIILACETTTGYTAGSAAVQWMDVNSAARAWAQSP